MSYAATLGYPLLRRLVKCPLCQCCKGKSFVVCWSCYQTHQLRNGNEQIEGRLAMLEYDAMALAEDTVFGSKEDAEKFFRTWRVRPNSRVTYF